ncbi:hypothetical protein EOM60_01455 [Candidatus Saccharibacteria bacterium]|nr:hypothetical protein [Candidatus Saccharibacteria bacterium]
MDKLLIISYVLTTAGGLVLLKLGTSGAGFISIIDGKFALNISALTIIGILLYGISFLLYIILISKYSLGYIVPLTTALVYSLVFLASYFVFKEGFTAVKLLAIVLIMGGVILLNSTSASNTSDKMIEPSSSSKSE